MNWEAIFWLVAMVIFIAAEAMTVTLVSIWFALGALGAMVVAIFDGALLLQIAVFVVISGVAAVPFSWELFAAGAFLNAVPGILVHILLIPVLQSVFTTRGIFLMNVACPSVWRYCSSMPRIFFRMGEMNRHNVIEGENCNV